jgi:hypothetical protein
MDFFKEQDKSRTKTTQLVGLFILAVLAVVLAVYAVAVFIMFFHGARQPDFNPAQSWILGGQRHPAGYFYRQYN